MHLIELLSFDEYCLQLLGTESIAHQTQNFTNSNVGVGYSLQISNMGLLILSKYYLHIYKE